MNKSVKQAFTLIELLVVIAIIGILSGLIVVSMGGMTTKATIAKAQIFSNSLRNSLLLDLVSEWKLDGDANDSWGKNNGTVVGADLIASGCVRNSCYSFIPANNDYITVPYSTDIRPTNKITVEAWASSVNWATGGLIVSCTEGGGYNIYAGTNGTGYTEVFLNGDYRRPQFYSSVPSIGWHHFMFTYDGRYIKTYFDGVYKNTYDATANYPITYSSYNNSFIIGADAGQSTTHGGGLFTGMIDEVRIYKETVSTSQIKEQYYTGLNSLLANGSISQIEYKERINETAQK